MRQRRRAVVAHRARLHDDAAELGMIDPLQHAALMQVRVVHDLHQGAHRRAGHAVLHQQREQVLLVVVAW